MLDKEIREPLFDFLEEFYGKIRIFEEKTVPARNFLPYGCFLLSPLTFRSHAV